jgi:hypothetical protein
VGYNRDHTACFIRDEQNARRAITLRLPSLFDLRFRKNPIGRDGTPPAEINRAMLHRPACFGSREEKEAYDNPKSPEAQKALIMEHDFWKVITPHKCWLEPKDDEKLSELLRAEMDRLRGLYEMRKKQTDDEIAALPPDDTERADELRNMLRGEFTTVTGGEHGGFKYISIFDITLDLVHRGWGGLREKLLEQEWMKHFSWNLNAVAAEAAAFDAWVAKLTYSDNKRKGTADLETKTVEVGVGLSLAPWQWEALQAAVRYEVRFADGTRCWLDYIEERAVTDPVEVEDFDRFEAEARRRDREELLRREETVEAAKAENLAKSETVAARLEEVVPKITAGAKDLAETEGEIAADAKDLKETLGKFPDLFDDPLVAAARDTSIKRGVPHEFAWWVLQKWHSDKFPTVGDALKRSGLRQQLERAGLPFSRSTVCRWLKIIREELGQRHLMPKRSLARSSSKTRDYDVTQAADTGPCPGDADEPPEEFVKWVEKRDASGAMPTVQDVLA